MNLRAPSATWHAPERAGHGVRNGVMLLGLLWLAAGTTAPAVASTTTPPAAQVAFIPAAGARLPRATAMIDAHGRPVRLGTLLDARPALVVPAYYGCSNLCGVVLAGVRAGLRSASLEAGRDLDVIVFSIAPLDTPFDAARMRRALLGTDAAAGWHFLTTDAAGVDALTTALGYRFVPGEEVGEYAHAAGVVMAAPDGRIVRVLYGVDFPPAALATALAAATTPGPPPSGVAAVATAGLVRQWLLCLHYDPRTGRYSFAAMTAVRTAGLVVLAWLAGYIVRARRREGRP